MTGKLPKSEGGQLKHPPQLRFLAGRSSIEWCFCFAAVQQYRKLVQSTVFQSQIELQTERRMRFRFPEGEPRQQPDTHQHTAESR
jgi:hypothetical protein